MFENVGTRFCYDDFGFSRGRETTTLAGRQHNPQGENNVLVFVKYLQVLSFQQTEATNQQLFDLNKLEGMNMLTFASFSRNLRLKTAETQHANPRCNQMCTQQHKLSSNVVVAEHNSRKMTEMLFSYMGLLEEVVFLT